MTSLRFLPEQIEQWDLARLKPYEEALQSTLGLLPQKPSLQVASTAPDIATHASAKMQHSRQYNVPIVQRFPV